MRSPLAAYPSRETVGFAGGVRGFDPEVVGGILPPSQVAIYNRWLAARDRAASGWFKTLFRRYALRTRYAQGFAPRSSAKPTP